MITIKAKNGKSQIVECIVLTEDCLVVSTANYQLPFPHYAIAASAPAVIGEAVITMLNDLLKNNNNIRYFILYTNCEDRLADELESILQKIEDGRKYHDAVYDFILARK